VRRDGDVEVPHECRQQVRKVTLGPPGLCEGDRDEQTRLAASRDDALLGDGMGQDSSSGGLARSSLTTAELAARSVVPAAAPRTSSGAHLVFGAPHRSFQLDATSGRPYRQGRQRNVGRGARIASRDNIVAAAARRYR
jgi:predicted nucleic acid-binding protein